MTANESVRDGTLWGFWADHDLEKACYDSQGYVTRHRLPGAGTFADGVEETGGQLPGSEVRSGGFSRILLLLVRQSDIPHQREDLGWPATSMVTIYTATNVFPLSIVSNGRTWFGMAFRGPASPNVPTLVRDEYPFDQTTVSIPQKNNLSLNIKAGLILSLQGALRS